MSNSTSDLSKTGKTGKVEKHQNLISQRAFAKLVGVSATAIWHHVKKGTITLVNGKIDPESAKRELVKKMDLTHGKTRINLLSTKEEKQKRVTQENKVDFNSSKAQRESYRAKLAELEYNEKAGTFINAKEVRDVNESIYRIFRDRLLNIPTRLSGTLAAEEDQKRVHDILEAEIKKAIEAGVNG